MKAKNKLKKAVKKTRNLPDEWFGREQAKIENLPSIRKKKERIRKNIFIERPTASYLEKVSKKYEISFTELANDILTQFVQSDKDKK